MNVNYIRRYYFRDLFTESNLATFVAVNWITEEQMNQMIEDKKAMENGGINQ